MLLLQDNLTLWKSNQQDEEAGENNAGTSVLTPPCHRRPFLITITEYLVLNLSVWQSSYSDYSDLLSALPGSSSGQIHCLALL